MLATVRVYVRLPRNYEKTFLGLEMCVLDLADSDVDLIIGAFEKVWDQLDCLR